MTEKELRNQVNDLNFKVQDIKKHNEILSDLYKEKNVLISNINNSFSDYAKNHPINVKGSFAITSYFDEEKIIGSGDKEIDFVINKLSEIISNLSACE